MEVLAATRLIQTEAVNRLLTLLDLTGAQRGRDRTHSRRSGGGGAVPAGGAAARGDGARLRPEPRGRLAILEWLEARTEVGPLLAEAIRELALADGGA